MCKQYQLLPLLLVIFSSLLSHASALIPPAQKTLHERSSYRVLGTSRSVLAAAATVAVPEAPSQLQPTKAVPEKQRRNSFERKNDNIQDDLWEVRVYNDEVNTHEWVARCLVVVAGATEWQAYLTTKLAHQEGDAHVGLYEREVAETYTRGLRDQGIVVQMFPVGDFQ